MKSTAALFGILMLAGAPPGAGERITIKVSPAIAFAPANLVVRATIPADADNRAVQIVAESADFYRSSEMPLEGERPPGRPRSSSAACRPGHIRSAPT